MEWRQKIPLFSSLFWANALLAVSAAGRMGGTTNVRMSRLFRMHSATVPYETGIKEFICVVQT